MKRLIVTSDGLWTSPSLPAHSNLAIMASALLPRDDNGTDQLLLTDPFQGLGEVRPCGRRTAHLKDSVCALYQQLSANHVAGDSIWFLGFSRGSYVVRACAGMIRNLGLLERRHLNQLSDAWHIYRTRWGADARNARQFRQAYCQPAAVRFLGAFDTLGERGIPRPLHGDETDDLPRFHDTTLSGAVQFAFHALAIDERRRGLAACLWHTTAERQHTEQCWFTGSHRDIGGIQGDMALANISLRWMLSRARALGLALDGPLLEQLMANRSQLGSAGAEEHNSGQVRKTGSSPRPLGVTNGDETLHPSAEQRFLRNPAYRPANLARFMKRDDQIQLPL